MPMRWKVRWQSFQVGLAQRLIRWWCLPSDSKWKKNWLKDWLYVTLVRWKWRSHDRHDKLLHPDTPTGDD